MALEDVDGDSSPASSGKIQWSMIPPPKPPVWDASPAPWHWTMMNDVPRNDAYR